MRRLRDYCDGLANCATLEGVGTLFRGTVAREGYASSACRVIAPAGKAPHARVLFRNWPEDWAKLTEERNFRIRNPVLAAALRRMDPFTWVDINDKRKKPATEQEIWNTASEWGWINGFVVPVHGPGGYFSCVSMASKEPNLDLSAERRAYLYLIALLAHERCYALDEDSRRADQPPALSERELECMRWVAAGKSDWEIGMILTISSSTVRFHVDSARRKLDATTRPQAVATLVARGLLTP
jgi:DNA-binding CsgD family transcriptional regulator